MKLTKELKEKICSIYTMRIINLKSADIETTKVIREAQQKKFEESEELALFKVAAQALMDKAKELTDPYPGILCYYRVYSNDYSIEKTCGLSNACQIEIQRLEAERDNLFIQIQYSTKSAALSAILKKYGIEV